MGRSAWRFAKHGALHCRCTLRREARGSHLVWLPGNTLEPRCKGPTAEERSRRCLEEIALRVAISNTRPQVLSASSTSSCQQHSLLWNFIVLPCPVGSDMYDVSQYV